MFPAQMRPGRLPERPMGADCKSVGGSLHRFESCTCHWFFGLRIPTASGVSDDFSASGCWTGCLCVPVFAKGRFIS